MSGRRLPRPVLRFLRWLLLNKYRHIEKHLSALLRGLEGRLVERLQRRVKAAVRVQTVRTFLYALLILPAYTTLIAGLLEATGVLKDIETGIAVLASVAIALAGLAALGLFLVQRSLGILEADIYMFSMIAVGERMRRGLPALPDGFGAGEQDGKVERGRASKRRR